MLVTLVGLALAADLVASEMPLLVRYRGHHYVLPNIFDPAALRTHTMGTLLASMEEDDWLIATPIPWGPNQQDKGHPALAAPSGSHWLGTDIARRDVLARLVHGSRVTLLVGVVSVSIYVLIGTFLGLLAGYLGGWVDALVSRVTEAVLSLPVFFLVLAVMGVMERAGIGTLMVVIGLVYWTRIARLVRAEALRLRSMEFVVAAKALGYSPLRIMAHHILPNAIGPVLVAATFGMAGAVLVEAALSFLGFGTPDTMASWGGLLYGVMGNFHAWWLVVFPGAAIFATVMAYNIAGEVVRDVLDPRMTD